MLAFLVILVLAFLAVVLVGLSPRRPQGAA